MTYSRRILLGYIISNRALYVQVNFQEHTFVSSFWRDVNNTWPFVEFSRNRKNSIIKKKKKSSNEKQYPSLCLLLDEFFTAQSESRCDNTININWQRARSHCFRIMQFSWETARRTDTYTETTTAALLAEALSILQWPEQMWNASTRQTHVCNRQCRPVFQVFRSPIFGYRTRLASVTSVNEFPSNLIVH